MKHLNNALNVLSFSFSSQYFKFISTLSKTSAIFYYPAAQQVKSYFVFCGKGLDDFSKLNLSLEMQRTLFLLASF